MGFASGSMGLTNAGRARRNAGPWPNSGPCRPSTRPGATGLPESRADSRTAELIKGVYDVDLDALRRRIPAGVSRRD